MLQDLQRYVPPRVGSSFFSLGVKWSSFRLINAFALATVQVGRHLEINLLGLASAAIPPKPGRNPSLVTAELALNARFAPDEGYVGVQGQLTPASHVFSPDCRITGGFAVSAWSKGVHANDFVLTFGGYHPGFRRPRAYPIVPRLGFQWRYNSELTFQGSMYSAVTPSQIMVGGRLNATYKSGKTRVSFTADANFLMGWKPYYYATRVNVRISVSYRSKSAEVGAAPRTLGSVLVGKGQD